MNSKMNSIVIAALFLVLFTSMMQMNGGVEAAKNNRNHRKLRGADNNYNEVDGQVGPQQCAECCGAVIAAECCSFCGVGCMCSF